MNKNLVVTKEVKQTLDTIKGIKEKMDFLTLVLIKKYGLKK